MLITIITTVVIANLVVYFIKSFVSWKLISISHISTWSDEKRGSFLFTNFIYGVIGMTLHFQYYG